MHIVHVFIHVKPEYIEDFIQATIKNAASSIQEPGIARFDFIQQQDDPTRFMLIEVYRNQDDPARHKETVHYNHWRSEVEKMMSEPRSAIKFSNLFPDENGWG